MKPTTAALALVALLATVSRAPAAPADGAPWRPLTDEAVRLFRAGRHEDAATRFRRARDAGAPPLVVYNLARCHQELERWAAARETFRAYLALDDGNEEARERARTALAAIEAQLATGWLIVEGAPVGATVLVDGAPVGAAPLAPLALEPGTYVVAVRAEGHAPWSATVEVVGGERVGCPVALTPTPPVAPAPGVEGGDAAPRDAAPRDAAPRDAAPPDGTPARFGPWTWVTLGSGVAVATAATVTWVLGEQDHAAIADADGYGSDAPVDMTRDRALALDASGDRKKLAGAILWGVGGALVATSTVLFVLDATTGSPAGTVHVGVAPTADGAFLSLGGAF